MEPALLEVKNLKKHFPVRSGVLGRQTGAVYAVDDVSFTIRHGETLGLVGESGCGKSTLGRTVLRLHEPTSGSLSFAGQDIRALNASAMRQLRRQMQIVFQDPFSSLNPRMTVEAVLAEPFQIHTSASRQEISREVHHLLEVVGLPSEAASRYPHEFSGGQRQRIGIARAIALKPKLIVCDEPVSALDVSIQSQILNLLVDLRQKFKLSYLFIAHDLAVIEHVSDIVAVMYLGKIVEMSRADDLYVRPSHPYTQALIAAIPVVDAGERSARRASRPLLKGDVPSPVAPPAGCHFHPRCPKATEICRAERPILRQIGTPQNPHTVACHHV